MAYIILNERQIISNLIYLQNKGTKRKEINLHYWGP
jgi:hypothetical protein